MQQYTEYHYLCYIEIPDILHVIGRDIIRLHELHDEEHLGQTEDREDFKVNPVRKELEDGTIASHSAKAIIAICWLSHQDSRWRDMVIVSEFTMLRQEPKHIGGREYLQLAHVLKNYDKERAVRKY